MIRNPAGYGGGIRIKRYQDYFQAGYGVAQLASDNLFTPAQLFASGAQGFWYDTSDLSTMFQDSAGTVPAALEQPVSYRADKSGRGNYAYQITPANAPVLSARVNLLTYTEQLTNAVWTVSETTVADNQTTAPNGYLTASELKEAATTDGHSISTSTTTVAGVAYRGYVRLKQGTQRYAVVSLATGASSNVRYSAVVDLQLGTITQNNTLNSPTGTSSSIRSLGNGWYSVALTQAATSTTSLLVVAISDTGTPSSFVASTLNPSYAGSTSNYIYVTQADLRASSEASALPVYQRVVTSTNYDVVGFPYYLRYNGTSQSLRTNNIDFSTTDKMSLFAGLRKLADTSAQIIMDFSSNGTNNTGTFSAIAYNAFDAPPSTYSFSSRGSTAAVAARTTSATYARPLTNIFTGLSDIAGDLVTLRLNGVQVAQTTTDQGTGNYTNNPAFFSARNSAALWFNARDYGMVCVGRALTTYEVTTTEAWLAAKTGLVI